MSSARRATVDDHRRLCRTAMRAFADDPVMRWLFPDDETYFAGDGDVYDWALRRWFQWDEVWTTDDAVALAAWIPPGRPDVVVPGPPPASPSPALVERFGIIARTVAEHTPAEPHWYLNLLGTHPDWQRQGLGRLVMDPVRRRADADGLPLYLETETEENVAYYRHAGFEVRSEWDLDGGGPHMWGMYREPGAAADSWPG